MELKHYFDLDKLQSVAEDFFNATGIGIYIIGNDFSDVKVRKTKWNPYCHAIRSTEVGKERCISSDEILLNKCKMSGKPEMHICHGGLVNLAAPIVCDGVTVGYVFFFSLREKPFSKVYAGISNLSLSKAELEDRYSRVPIYDKMRLDSAVSLALMLIEHVITSGMIRASKDETLALAERYICDNLERPLSVRKISAGANISKSALYRMFSKHYGYTLSEYVNRKRIERAERLLLYTNKNISEIAFDVGFCSEAYFRLVFKKLKGVTPIKYRISIKRKEEN